MPFKKIGLIGWRGMVGQVLLNRLEAEKDLEKDDLEVYFFSTSNPGGNSPQLETVKLNENNDKLKDAWSLDELSPMDIIISCQGGDYTQEIHPQLRKSGWSGFWIDAASTLRMKHDSCIVLDPINRAVIDEKIREGVKNFIGSNCTVSVMLMGIGGLIKADLVEWVSVMSYQAISGAGAKAMQELIEQMNYLSQEGQKFSLAELSAVEIDSKIKKLIKNPSFPQEKIGSPLIGSLLPWIDREVEAGQSREEKKGFEETNKILNLEGSNNTIAIDGTCVRVPTLRCHSMGLTIKLKKPLPLEEITTKVSQAHPWVKVIPNDKAATLSSLNPYSVSGSLNIHVGRLRKMNLGEDYLNAFIIGDQLTWGAAEPLRRMLLILLGRI